MIPSPEIKTPLFSESTTKKMMQSELLLPTWPAFNFPCSSLNENTPYDSDMDFCGINESDFSSSFTSPGESSMISSSSYAPTMFSNDFLDLENLVDDIQINSAMEGLETISSGEIEDICEWINTNDAERVEWSPNSCISLESFNNSELFSEMPIILPGEEMGLDNQLSILHLIRAYGEAIENGDNELAEVIAKSINEKSNTMGTTMERVAYNLFKSRENEGEYLRQESSKNLTTAFKVFYQSLPCGRFAHFTANSAILESIPDEATMLHVIDFDIGEGIQWPSLIEAISRTGKTLKLTSIKSAENCWDFEETKNRLQDHAKEQNLKLLIKEKCIEDLAGELMRMKKKGQGKEWLVFNCTVGLPHMGRRRSRNHVSEYLNIARESLANFQGILVFGDGEALESHETCPSYALFFDRLMRHYQALFDSLEMNFPAYLAEARTALESLFLAPFMCPNGWSQDWEEMRKGCYNLDRMGSRKVSKESLAEAKEMVNERENSYNVKIEGLRENEIVLKWKETPIVRVSTWM